MARSRARGKVGLSREMGLTAENICVGARFDQHGAYLGAKLKPNHMITRLKVDGFKNLVDQEVYFGPFTCFAGMNGVGKSNVFDVLEFLSYLADFPIVEAIEKVRGDTEGGISNKGIGDIFRTVNGVVHNRIHIEVDMIITSEGIDELGQPTRATGNFLSYRISLRLITVPSGASQVEITREELNPITKGNALKHLPFPHAPKWRNSIIYNNRKGGPYISSQPRENSKEIYVNLHQDGGSAGKPNPFLAGRLPRTVLSTARYASETPTVLLARREMQSWKFLQLEPTSLRQPDDLDKVKSDIRVSHDGAHLPATVYRLSRSEAVDNEFNGAEGLYTLLANKLSELIPNISRLRVDKDEKRRLLTLEVVTRDGTTFPARSLSDGTLRFLALAILEVDYQENGLICLEEPENGIHPARIPIIITLLKDIVADVFDPEDVSLRQVIINTHSPGVIGEITEDDLVYVDSRPYRKDGMRFAGARMSALQDTWRSEKTNMNIVDKGKIITYLDPVRMNFTGYDDTTLSQSQKVKDRVDMRRGIQGNLFEIVQ